MVLKVRWSLSEVLFIILYARNSELFICWCSVIYNLCGHISAVSRGMNYCVLIRCSILKFISLNVLDHGKCINLTMLALLLHNFDIMMVTCSYLIQCSYYVSYMGSLTFILTRSFFKISVLRFIYSETTILRLSCGP